MNYIWFDLGYTLVHVNREEIYQKRLIACEIDRSVEEIRLAFHLADKYFMREFPGLLGKKQEVYAEKYHHVLHDYLDIDIKPIPQELLKPADINNPKGEWTAFNETIPTLKKLKEMGFGIGLISNWNNTARDVLQATGIIAYLDHIVISSEINIEKPDERIFQYAFEQAGVPAEECLYVGDNYYDDVLGSRKVGMQSILINPYGEVGIEELEDIHKITNIKELIPAIQSMVLRV